VDLPGSERQPTPKEWGKWAHAETSRSLKAMAKLDAYKARMSKMMLEGGRVLFAKKLEWKPQVTVSQKDSALAFSQRVAAARDGIGMGVGVVGWGRGSWAGGAAAPISSPSGECLRRRCCSFGTMAAPGGDNPRPAHFPLLQGGPEGPLPWVPRAWFLPLSASLPTYDIPYVRMWWTGSSWYVPNGRLYIQHAGPPGLSARTQVRMTWWSEEMTFGLRGEKCPPPTRKIKSS